MKAIVFSAAAALLGCAMTQGTPARAASPDQVAAAHGQNAPYMPFMAPAPQQAVQAAPQGSAAERQPSARPASFAAVRKRDVPAAKRFRR